VKALAVLFALAMLAAPWITLHLARFDLDPAPVQA